MRQSIFSPRVRAAVFRSSRIRVCAALLIGMAFLCAVQPARAQRYKSLCAKALKKAEAQTLAATVRSAIRNPGGFGADEADVEKFFNQYYFLKLTCMTPEDLGGLGKMREDLFKQYIVAARNPDSQRKLTEIALRPAQAFAKDNYHPSVRYNATLILGNLDAQYATRGKPPVPFPAATAVLLDLLEKDSFKSRDGKSVAVHPSVKSGALVGLERHARYGVDDRHSERFTKVLSEFVAKEDRPEEVSKKVFHWMKCQAMAAIVQQSKNQPTPQMQQMLEAFISNDKFSLDDRCYVASLMEQVKFSAAQEFDGMATLKALGKLSQDVMTAEDKLAKEYEEELLEAGGGGGGRGFRGGYGERGGFGGSGESDGTQYEGRRLLSRLRAIERAGVSVKEGASAEVQANITELLALMQPIRIEAAEDDPKELTLAQLVRAKKPEVDRLVNGWTGGGATEEPADLDDEFAVR